jgi:amidase
MVGSDICFMTATEMAGLLKTKKLSAREGMESSPKQIERVNSKVNAIVTLIPAEQLMTQARDADEAMARGKGMGPLHSLPVAVKDMENTKGVRTTSGSCSLDMPFRRLAVTSGNSILHWRSFQKRADNSGF